MLESAADASLRLLHRFERPPAQRLANGDLRHCVSNFRASDANFSAIYFVPHAAPFDSGNKRQFAEHRGPTWIAPAFGDVRRLGLRRAVRRTAVSFARLLAPTRLAQAPRDWIRNRRRFTFAGRDHRGVGAQYSFPF